MKIKSDYSNEPQWREVNIKSSLPKELTCLDEIAHNLWYGWTHEARSLFTHLDEELYEKVGHNPVLLLEQLSYDRKEAIVKDKELMKRVKNVYKMFKDYMNVKPNTKTPISSLLLYGVRPQSGIKNLFWWFGNARWRLSQRSIRL